MLLHPIYDLPLKVAGHRFGTQWRDAPLLPNTLQVLPSPGYGQSDPQIVRLTNIEKDKITCLPWPLIFESQCKRYRQKSWKSMRRRIAALFEPKDGTPNTRIDYLKILTASSCTNRQIVVQSSGHLYYFCGGGIETMWGRSWFFYVTASKLWPLTFVIWSSRNPKAFNSLLFNTFPTLSNRLIVGNQRDLIFQRLASYLHFI